MPSMAAVGVPFEQEAPPFRRGSGFSVVTVVGLPMALLLPSRFPRRVAYTTTISRGRICCKVCYKLKAEGFSLSRRVGFRETPRSGNLVSAIATVPETGKHVIEWVRNIGPDTHYDIDDIISEGDKVAVRMTVSGSHTGPLRDIPPLAKVSRLTTSIGSILRTERSRSCGP